MSVEAEKRIGRNANAGSAHTAANFSSKLLLPIPQSPRIANELVRPAVSPCCKASRNASMWWLRPTNSSGLTGKLGSGRMSDLQNHRSDACQRMFVTFVTFVTFAGLHGRRHEHTPPTVQRWKELFGGSCYLWVGSLRGLVRGFGNEGVVLNEGAGDYSFRPVDSELDECKRDLFGYDLLRGKDQGAERDHTLPARHLDAANAAANLVSLDKPSTAEHVVEIGVWRQLDLFGYQAVLHLTDYHRYNDCRLITLNVDLCAWGVQVYV